MSQHHLSQDRNNRPFRGEELERAMMMRLHIVVTSPRTVSIAFKEVSPFFSHVYNSPDSAHHGTCRGIDSSSYRAVSDVP